MLINLYLIYENLINSMLFRVILHTCMNNLKDVLYGMRFRKQIINYFEKENTLEFFYPPHQP